MKDNRGRKLVAVAHCLLNQNAKVQGLAAYPGVFEPLLPVLSECGVGILQLPCPEMIHLGPLRPLGTDTYEQYDSPAYREVCQAVAEQVAVQLATYQNAGYRVLFILGIDGSPSCSVTRVPHLTADGSGRLEAGSGIFMEILSAEIGRRGLGIPVVGLPETPEAGDLGRALRRLKDRIVEG
ncbi:MAG: DUF523 domain-containing protein [Bradymonadales bacterium]|nr:DUF523 domain-containing protein [Bradymonadales bacterium]